MSVLKPEEFFSDFTAKKMLNMRTILLFGEINQELAEEITEKMLVLAQESKEPIKLIINSPGGHVESADTLFDLIRFLDAPVRVVGTGWVASAAALIYSAPKLENRFCLPNTRFLLHQPSGGVMGQASDIGIEALEIVKIRERLNRILAEQTGQPIEKIAQDTDRNFWMSAEEARDYGLVGKIVTSVKEVD